MATLKIQLDDVHNGPKPTNIEAAASSTKKHIQIRDLSAEKHREVKAYAAERGLTISDLMMNAYEFYRKNHP